MARGHIAFVLHAHLPYVRHPEHETFLEERWFFEGLAETYVPLLQVLEGLEDDGVDYRLVLGLSPTLVTMLEDEVLQARCADHLRRVIALADRQADRWLAEPARSRLARWYADRFRDILYVFEERYGRRLAPAFARLAGAGRLELMTCAATHAFLPLLEVNPAAVRAQVRTAVEYHEEVFGVPPRGFWLPECAYVPGLETFLDEVGIRYFFLDSHGLEHADPPPARGVYAPVLTPSGVAAFARDPETSHQVWAAEQGYPGHGDYREFYRDLGFELPEAEVADFLVDGRVRTATGIKCFRITDRDAEAKDLYDPDRAFERVCAHADDFLRRRAEQIDRLADASDRPPLIVSPYDAELFGHWWFEGPRFLDILFRKMCYDQEAVKPMLPAEYLRRYPEAEVTVPAASSWGAGGTYEYWMNPENDAIYRDLHRAADLLGEWVDRTGEAASSETSETGRVLRQMSRELMLAQASDWPFIMRSGTSPGYALGRVRNHLARFHALEGMLRAGRVEEETLEALEFVDRIFPQIRPAWYGAKAAAVGGSPAS